MFFRKTNSIKGCINGNDFYSFFAERSVILLCEQRALMQVSQNSMLYKSHSKNNVMQSSCGVLGNFLEQGAGLRKNKSYQGRHETLFKVHSRNAKV